jgi:hypothetical protein
VTRVEWELTAQAAAAAMGMTFEEYAAEAPRLTRENELVREVWVFCDGWQPAALPLALAYYGVRDCEFVVSQLLVMRGVFAAAHASDEESAG